MKTLRIRKAKQLKGKINIPGDKSISHRAIMIGALARGRTVVNGFLPSYDCLATVACFNSMGIHSLIESRQDPITGQVLDPSMLDNKVTIRGNGLRGLKKPKEMLNVGNSGTTIRLIAGILAGQDFEVKISGDESIEKRPMGRIAKPLRDMGASIEGRIVNNELYAPLKIIGGKLKAIRYELPVASAQVKSAVLLAGLFAEGKTTVIEKAQSRDHTERMLEHFGAGSGEFDGVEVDVPGDISSAAFFLVAGLLAPDSQLQTNNVGLNPTRTGIIDVLHRMGAKLEVENEQILSNEPRGEIIVRSSELGAVELDGEIMPRIIDEIPIIAVAATQAKGTTVIRGANELRIKESDRIRTISVELSKMGAKIEELEDGLKITGPTKLHGATVQSHGDHRIAMSLAIAGLVAEGETTIENTDCIETSFPGFETLLSLLSR